MERLAAFEDVLVLTEVDEQDRDYVEALIAEASDLIQAYCRRTFTAPVPGVVTRVAARMVARALNGGAAGELPVGVTQFSNTAGPFNRQFSFADGATDGGVWLAKADKIKLGGYRGAAFTVNMAGTHTVDLPIHGAVGYPQF